MVTFFNIVYWTVLSLFQPDLKNNHIDTYLISLLSAHVTVYFFQRLYDRSSALMEPSLCTIVLLPNVTIACDFWRFGDILEFNWLCYNTLIYLATRLWSINTNDKVGNLRDLRNANIAVSTVINGTDEQIRQTKVFVHCGPLDAIVDGRCCTFLSVGGMTDMNLAAISGC